MPCCGCHGEKVEHLETGSGRIIAAAAEGGKERCGVPSALQEVRGMR